MSYTPPVKNTTKSTTRSNVSKQPNYISKSGRNASPDDASSSVTGNAAIASCSGNYWCVF